MVYDEPEGCPEHGVLSASINAMMRRYYDQGILAAIPVITPNREEWDPLIMNVDVAVSDVPASSEVGPVKSGFFIF